LSDRRELNDRCFSIGISGLLLRRHRPQVGHDRIEILLAHARIPGEAHRGQQLATVLADALRDGAPDLGVAPAADASDLVRGDVTRHTHAPRAFELLAAFAEAVLEVAVAIAARRVAFHAMADRHEIEAALHRVLQLAFRHWLLRTGRN